MSQYTCNSCGLAFGASADQHEHMRSEWHRYNLKRRVAELPPISEDSFNSKVAILEEQKEAERQAAQERGGKGKRGGRNADDTQRTVTKKELRRREKEAIAEKRRVLLEQARELMLRSQGQSLGPVPILPESQDKKEQVPELEEDTKEETEEDKENQEEQELTEEQLMEQKLANYTKIPENTCLFSGKKFDTFEESLDFMFKNYGFYIPEQKFLVDKLGLVEYLAEKIALGNICLCCHYQGRSLEAVRAHMISKRHCRIPYESENEKLEISEFYDFSSTYADVLDKVKNLNIVSATEDDDEGEWEDVSDDEDQDDEEDEDVPQELSYQHGYELHLPSGAVAGHRSLQRYYRQHVLPEKVLSEGQGTVVAAETRHMAKIYDKKELALKKRIWKRETKANDVNDRRAAKFINNQPHYRDQLLQ